MCSTRTNASSSTKIACDNNGGKKVGKGEKMSKADAARIRSSAAKTGRNQDFAKRAQSAGDRNEA